MLAARASGAVAGWGFQFQAPAFVAGMSWLLFAVGVNLSGVFEVSGRLAGTGQGLAMRGGHIGSFFTGLLAVLVAEAAKSAFQCKEPSSKFSLKLVKPLRRDKQSSFLKP